MLLRELPGLIVTVNQVVHAPDLTGPARKPHVFVYFITITNESDVTVTIKGRKWVVREANGETLAVEGDGVVGEFPRLEPGEQFHYNSSHGIAADAVAEGAYLGLTDSGEAVFTRIPAFRMRVPKG
ncbi:MAG TPA: ApaG domain [Chthoniobacterales bacterium]|jgi:ApaG protein